MYRYVDLYASPYTPAILHINKEARKVGLKIYHTIRAYHFGDTNEAQLRDQTMIYVGPSDTLLYYELRNTHHNPMIPMRIIDRFPSSKHHQVLKVAIYLDLARRGVSFGNQSNIEKIALIWCYNQFNSTRPFNPNSPPQLKLVEHTKEDIVTGSNMYGVSLESNSEQTRYEALRMGVTPEQYKTFYFEQKVEGVIDRLIQRVQVYHALYPDHMSLQEVKGAILETENPWCADQYEFFHVSYNRGGFGA